MLKNSVSKTDLAFFTSDLLPVSGKMRASSQKWNDKGRELEGKLYATLEFQVRKKTSSMELNNVLCINCNVPTLQM